MFSLKVLFFLFFLAKNTSANKKQYTGWPKKVSHFQIIRKSY